MPKSEATTPQDAAALSEAILRKLTYDLGKSRAGARDRDWFMATALAVRDRMVDRWLTQLRASYETGKKQVYYLSLEFLIGRLLRDCISNLGLNQEVAAALASLGVDFEQVRQAEPDAALGNGGLGRLAACFMESMASLGIPAFGYGIRYEHGLFRQLVREGWQREYPEDWLTFGNPWEYARPEIAHDIGFGGSVEAVAVSELRVRHVWHPAETVQAVAYDTPVVGWRGRHVNTLRLWSARAIDPLKLEAFNFGDHVGALADRMRQESICKVLYPSDETPAGQELRLRQEYFFASAALQDLVRRHLRVYGDLRSLPEKVAIQLNDTHPAIAIAELMRICVDQHDIAWDEAWEITRGCISYTNHTLLPEALESWPVPLMERLLPRHMQIIYLINAHHLDSVRHAHPEDGRLLSSVSLIEEGHGRRVRMGHLAFIGSHKVNGVSALHSELLKQTVFADFHALSPGRIVNKTNGITFRRWLHQANPGLTGLLTEALGPEVLDRPSLLPGLVPQAEDAGFRGRFAAVKRANKEALASVIRHQLDLRVDPGALFDVQIKRIHEYKRQLLNILETVALYDAIRAQPMKDWVPRVKIFAGKAAASYHRAKLIIKLAHDVARVVNSDPTLRGALKLAFLPNYNVSLAELIVPAADLSEQISTAGMEASGTGNMKLALNGALTIGTLDGANVEILEHVGAENIHIFGLTTEQVAAHRAAGTRGEAAVAASPRLGEVLEALESGVFSPDEPDRYRGLVASLRGDDYFLVSADFDHYWEAQRAVDARWRDPAAWQRAAVLNTAHMGWFSSDRTIAEYAEDIWRVPVAHTA
ncbi:glycogen/starch/alpha-glucan phosphorylase [Siccirubricoccus sp. KC 17139]|uniref:Alpha-1,4 glucan phosphorylase n=1 Tax=Siccirubricoccus soli TaxID=2899147 RepID=A0ABT1D4A4_9PROT|nr:glycogen/starch/alpha-glucan phosphorylase [Siccirubricoccus soli]MCO6416746.1 glycogen/starch/alpha-glucan phosphorylase [Siccirubricoccus soli]MCP2682881.1 glycogen/starch/alpha-glucan phosphorylase [Siccirubricoccus soli]